MAKLIDYNTLLKGYSKTERQRTWNRIAPGAFAFLDGESQVVVTAPPDVIDAVVAGMTEKRGWIVDDRDQRLIHIEFPTYVENIALDTGSLVGAWLYTDQANGRVKGQRGILTSAVIKNGALWMSDGHRLHKSDIVCPSDVEYLFDSGVLSLLVRTWAVSPRSARIDIGRAKEGKALMHYARVVNGPIGVTVARPFAESGWCEQVVSVVKSATKITNGESKYAIALHGNPTEVREAVKRNELGDKSKTVAFMASKSGAAFIGADANGIRHPERSPRTPMPVFAVAGADIAAHDDTIPMWCESRYLIDAIDPAATTVTLYVASALEPVVVLHDGSVTSSAVVMPVRPVEGFEQKRPSEVRELAQAEADAAAAVAAAQAAREAAADF
jgi:hypothetical protein